MSSLQAALSRLGIRHWEYWISNGITHIETRPALTAEQQEAVREQFPDRSFWFGVHK